MLDLITGRKYKITVELFHSNPALVTISGKPAYFFRDEKGNIVKLAEDWIISAEESFPSVRRGDVWLDKEGAAWMVSEDNKLGRFSYGGWILISVKEFFRNHPKATRIHRES